MYLAHSFPPLHTGLVNYPAPIRRGREIQIFSFPTYYQGHKYVFKSQNNCDGKDPPNQKKKKINWHFGL